MIESKPYCAADRQERRPAIAGASGYPREDRRWSCKERWNFGRNSVTDWTVGTPNGIQAGDGVTVETL